MINKLTLPRTFKDNSKDGKYKKLEGLPKVSYSQLGSWKSLQYRPGYIKQYFAGIELPSGIYALKGSSAGSYIEGRGTNDFSCHEEYKHLLNDEERTFLDSLDYPENSVYEDYIVVDMGDFVIEGYADRCTYGDTLTTLDYKTGSIEKKTAEYASPEYRQTRLYSYQKELEGHTIGDCGVLLLDRAGNGFAKSPLRLTGKSLYIPTPYDKLETEAWLDGEVRKIVREISDLYTQYLKFFD